ASAAVALRTRLLDHGAVAAAARARLREREEPLALRLHTAAVALGTDDRRGSRARASAAALTARHGQLDGHLDLGAVERVLEREMHLRDDVIAAHRLPLHAGSAARAAAEDAAEQVAEVADVEAAEV